MKMNWSLSRSQKLSPREHGDRNQALGIANLVDRDSEIQGILDASTQANSLYGGIPTATRPIPQTPPKTDVLKSPLPEKVAERSENWSTPVQNLLDQPPSAFPQKVMLGGVAFFAIFGAWAWFGEISEIGYARGEIIHQGKVHKMQSVVPGKIAHLAVKEGDPIAKGQVIAELDTQQLETEIDRFKEQISAFEVQLAQTQSLIDRQRTESRTLAAISQSDLQAQNTVIAQADSNAKTIELSIERLHEDIAEAETRSQRLAVREETIPELLEQQLQDEIEANQTRIDRLKPLVEQGAISRDFLFQAERDLRNSQNALLRTKSGDLDDQTNDSERLFEAEQAQRDRQSRLVESQGQLEQAQSEKERLLAQFDQKKAEGERTQLDIQEQIQKLEVERTQIQAKLAETRHLLASAQTEFQQRFLHAPVDGVVLSSAIDHSGEVVQPGQTIAEIAPTSAELVLSANLPTKEAGFIELGMPTKVKFDSYPYQEYGLISGKVTSISPDTKPDQQLGEVYKIEITLEQNHVIENQEKIYFKPGQTASADIIIRRRRIIDVILDPVRQLQKSGAIF
jgi:hemolysin D